MLPWENTLNFGQKQGIQWNGSRLAAAKACLEKLSRKHRSIKAPPSLLCLQEQLQAFSHQHHSDCSQQQAGDFGEGF